MNLKSCDKCGVVFDKSKITFPETWNEDASSYDARYCEWREGYFVAFVTCPVCKKGKIFDED